MDNSLCTCSDTDIRYNISIKYIYTLKIHFLMFEMDIPYI